MLISKTLESFMAVAKQGTIKDASASLNLTSSPVSRRIKILEDWVGFKLFTRRQNDLILTDRGKEFYDELLPFHERMHNIQRCYATSRKREIKKNILKIGMEIAYSINVNKFIDAYRKNQRINNVFYLESGKEDTLEKLLSGEIEMIISHRSISRENIMVLELPPKKTFFFFNHECYSSLSDKSIDTIFIIEQKKFGLQMTDNISSCICKSFKNAQILIINNIRDYIDLIYSGKAVGVIDEFDLLNSSKICNEEVRTEMQNMDTGINISTYIYYLKNNLSIIKFLNDRCVTSNFTRKTESDNTKLPSFSF